MKTADIKMNLLLVEKRNRKKSIRASVQQEEGEQNEPLLDEQTNETTFKEMMSEELRISRGSVIFFPCFFLSRVSAFLTTVMK